MNQRFLEIFIGLVPPVNEWPLRTFHISMAVKGNQFITYGTNLARTHPINLRNGKRNSSGIDFSGTKMSCSELVCLMRVKRKSNIPFEKITLINFRVDRNLEMCNSKPCGSCSSLLKFLRLRKCLYSTPNGFELYK